MNRRLQRLLVLSLVIGTLASAAEKPTYSFLRNDYGARAAAMGGSFISMTDDPNLLFYNPAGLGTLEHSQFSLGFFKHLMDINSGYVSYAQHIQDLGHVAAGMVYINYGEFTRRDERGNDLGQFSANEFALSVAYAEDFMPNGMYGVGVKFIYSGIAEATSTAMALDLGGLWSFPEQRLTVGVSLLNMGTQLNPYYTIRENLPLDLKVGATIQPEHLPLHLNLNFHKLNDTRPDFISRFRSFSIGGEFTVSDEVRLRFGYNNEQRRDLKIGAGAGLAGISFGAGIVTEPYKVDYAFNSLGKIGALHRISLGMIL
jgi:hypothetical protein